MKSTKATKVPAKKVLSPVEEALIDKRFVNQIVVGVTLDSTRSSGLLQPFCRASVFPAARRIALTSLWLIPPLLQRAAAGS